MKKRTTLLFCLIWAASSTFFAQHIPYVDSVYSETVRSVLFYNVNDPMGMPVVDLKGYLMLNFDEVGGELKNYSYTIEQCDRDWKPTKLDKNEYLEGLQEDRLLNFKNAQATNVAYTRYALAIPNETMRFNKSGNYILHVFEDGYDRKPVLTRRFVVFEPVLSILPELAIPLAAKYNTHQEIDFKIDPKTFRIQNPLNDIRATIIQNQRWDNARKSVPPFFTQGNTLVFDYQDSIVFPPGKEWRYVDLRSSRFRNERIGSILQGDETWEVMLKIDFDRNREPYLVYPDLNGRYFVETLDFNNNRQRTTTNLTDLLGIATSGGSATDWTSIFANESLNADYVNAHFALQLKEPLEDADVYLFGALSDWKIDERFKMQYNELRNLYEGEVLLKQGFYNYIYAVVPQGTKKIDCQALEGDWYEAQNEYVILVYYRPAGARHDRVIGYSKFNANRRG